MNILKHPIYKAIYDLCHAIEELPASEQQTKLVIMAANLEKPADQLYAELQDALSRIDPTVLERTKRDRDYNGIPKETGNFVRQEWLIAGPDHPACSARSSSGGLCSRPVGHPGDHIAI